jgi:parallel beta-helix repeat protein
VHHATEEHRIGLRRISRHAHGLILTVIAALALGAAPAGAQPACGDVLTQSTTLTADLECEDTALRIGAPGITLDLSGHRVYTSDEYAIVNEGHADVTIRNGEIRGEGGMIHLAGVTGNVVRDVYAEGLIKGILVEDSDHNRFVDNHAHSVPFSVIRSDHNVIARNKVTEYESSLGVTGDHNRIVDNIVWGSFGLSLGLSGDHNQVRRNALLNDTFWVVRLNDVNDTDFVGNTIGAPGSYLAPGAATIESSSRNRFVGNTVFSVPQGFDLRSGADNVFRDNDLSGVPMTPGNPFEQFVPDGLAARAGVTGTLLRDNNVRGFGDDGIDVDAAGTRLRGNAAEDNGDLGIEAVPGVIDLGANTASGNGNPLQCTNVFCG